MNNSIVRTVFLVVTFVVSGVVLVIAASRGPCEPFPANITTEYKATVCTLGSCGANKVQIQESRCKDADENPCSANMINVFVLRNGVATEGGELIKLGCLTFGNPPCAACIALIAGAGAEVPVANLIIAGLLCNGICGLGVDLCC